MVLSRFPRRHINILFQILRVANNANIHHTIRHDIPTSPSPPKLPDPGIQKVPIRHTLRIDDFCIRQRLPPSKRQQRRQLRNHKRHAQPTRHDIGSIVLDLTKRDAAVLLADARLDE